MHSRIEANRPKGGPAQTTLPTIAALAPSPLPPAASSERLPPIELPGSTLPRVHEALRGILRVTPLAIGTLFDAVKEHLPHRRKRAPRGCFRGASRVATRVLDRLRVATLNP